MERTTFILKTGLNEQVIISQKAALKSKYIQTMFMSNPQLDVINVNTDLKSLQIVAQFLEHHEEKDMAEIPKPLKDFQKFANNISDPWDAQLVYGISREAAFSLIRTAQELQIPSLISLVSSYCAFLINGKSVEEIRSFFEVENDLNDEEKKQIQRENACLNV
ncbi:hypothetical protein WA158_004036 [Blastocystis sp. Blastoise]